MANRFARLTGGMKGWWWRLLLVTGAVLWLTLVAAAWEGSAHAAERGTDAEYNFSWLDPEKKIYVLQNRKFLKEGHLLLSAMAGTGFSNPYRSTVNLDGRMGYYFSEAWGLEAFVSPSFNFANASASALSTSAPNAGAVIHEIRYEYALMLDWAPWYAKINVFNQILYFDWYLEAGAGGLDLATGVSGGSTSSPTFTEAQTPTVYLGTGHMFHVSQAFFVRLDFLAALYLANVSGGSSSNALYSDYKFTLGVGLSL